MPNQQRLSKRRPRRPRAAGLPRPPQDPTHGALHGAVADSLLGIFGASDRGCKRYDLRSFGLLCLCPRKSAILTTPARGRCLRKLTKCSRMRIATSFTV